MTTPRYVYGESMLDPEGRFIWYCIPKNASRSLIKMLGRRGARRIVDIAPDASARDWAQAQVPPAFSFAFVRHPYARLISVWGNKVWAPLETPGLARAYAQAPGLERGMALDDFVAWLEQGYAAGRIDKHWRRQSDFVCGEAGCCLDFIGRIESFKADLARLESIIGPLGPMLHQNRSKPQGSPETPLSDRSKAIIRELYAEDFKLFGYAL